MQRMSAINKFTEFCLINRQHIRVLYKRDTSHVYFHSAVSHMYICIYIKKKQQLPKEYQMQIASRTSSYDNNKTCSRIRAQYIVYFAKQVDMYSGIILTR